MVDILMPLVDPLNRYIDYLRISVTDRCNLNCVYCKPRERMKALPHREILQYEEILRLVSVAAPLGISRVRITGGEPLIRRGIVDFARLTLDRRLHVRFIEFMPIGAGDRWNTEVCVTAGQVREIIEREVGRLEPFTSGTGAGPSENHQIPGARGVIGFISPITKHFCATCRRLRLTADGKIRPCLLSDTEIDIKSPLRGGCDDKELERLLRLALEVKPERHYINETPAGCYQRTMSGIGG